MTPITTPSPGLCWASLAASRATGDVVDDSEQNIRLKVDQMERLRIARIHLSRL
jgi:hypothetical protein